MSVRVLVGDALTTLRGLESESVNCVVTSPPYYGLRSYGTEPQVWGGDTGHEHDWKTVTPPGYRSSDTKPGPLQHPGNVGRDRLTSGLCSCGAWCGELGHEPTPALFIEHLIAIFEEVRRVLRTDGTCWVNLGDSYAGGGGGNYGDEKSKRTSHGQHPTNVRSRQSWLDRAGVKPKDALLIPERFVIAAQDAGWWVRSKIVWAKKACMPESVKDRPTNAWEPIYLLTKARRYWYDADAVRQPSIAPWNSAKGFNVEGQSRRNIEGRIGHREDREQDGANLRNVWHLGPEPSSIDHYATFPTEIPRRCILAGCPEGGTVLDPFAGTGTTLMVSDRLRRHAIGIELNEKDARRAAERVEADAGPMLADVAVAVEQPSRQPDLFGAWGEEGVAG